MRFLKVSGFRKEYCLQDARYKIQDIAVKQFITIRISSSIGAGFSPLNYNNLISKALAKT